MDISKAGTWKGQWGSAQICADAQVIAAMQTHKEPDGQRSIAAGAAQLCGIMW